MKWSSHIIVLCCVVLCIFFGFGIAKAWQRILVIAPKHGLALDIPVFGHKEMVKEETLIVPTSTPATTAPAEVKKSETVTPPPVVETPEREPAEPVSALPKRMSLAVPFTSQAPEKKWSQPWQDACEEAALLMMDAYYKDYSVSPLFAKDEIIKMVAWEEERGWGLSIEIEKMKQLAEEFLQLNKKGTLKIVENPTIEQLKGFIAAGKPVLVVADGKVLPNPHFQNGGPEYHALVIRGYTEKQFITNDPGTQFGENFMYQYQDLMDSIRDWNGGDVKTGRRVVMIVE